MSATAEALSLYRSFLRLGSKFPNYNIREFILRRAKDGFRGSRSSCNAQDLLKAAKEDLEVVRRQSVVYQMYGSTTKNVLEMDMVGDKH